MPTMRQARRQYFTDNSFGDDGGYNDKWVTVKLLGLPVSIPNVEARRDAVRYHDLHHIVTGYPTDWSGEARISAWEVASGCKNMWAAWMLNLWTMGMKYPTTPRPIYRAFIRGRNSRNLYGQDIDVLLEQQVNDVRDWTGAQNHPPPATAADHVAFAFWSVVAVSVCWSPVAGVLALGGWLLLG